MSVIPRAKTTSQIVTLPPLPELFDPHFLDVFIPASAREEVESSNAMMDALQSTAHPKLTASAAPAFSSTGTLTLDAYIGLRTGISGQSVDRFLEDTCAKDSRLSLCIIWNIRSIHDGKSEKELHYRTFVWLFENHPRMAITNLHSPQECGPEQGEDEGAAHGYWKDLPNILVLATVDELRPRLPFDPHADFLHNYHDANSRPAFKNNEEQETWPREQHVQRGHRAYDQLMRKLKDKHHRALYVTVARLFADQLAKDADVMDKLTALSADADKAERMALMNAFTLAPKRALTPGGARDGMTNISSAICLLLYGVGMSSSIIHRISFSASTSLPASDMHLFRCFCQRRVLTRGRRYTYVPEPLMSANRWSEIDYARVASICRNNNKERFFMKDEERLLNYLLDVESGKEQVSGTTLLPHLLATEAAEIYNEHPRIGRGSFAFALYDHQRRLSEVRGQVVDAQWATLVTRLRESGQLDNSIAVCDVSGSMGSLWSTSRGRSAFDVEPIWPALSFSLVARLAKPPFNDAFITFSIVAVGRHRA